MHTFSMSLAVKIVENHLGVATVHMSAMQLNVRPAPAQAMSHEMTPMTPPVQEIANLA